MDTCENRGTLDLTLRAEKSMCPFVILHTKSRHMEAWTEGCMAWLKPLGGEAFHPHSQHKATLGEPAAQGGRND